MMKLFAATLLAATVKATPQDHANLVVDHMQELNLQQVRHALPLERLHLTFLVG